MRIGTMDGVLAGRKAPVPWSALYPMAKELGFEGLELGVGQTYDQSELWTAEGRDRLRSAATAAGVETPSICIHSFWHFSPASPDPAVRERATRIAREAAVAARQMGARNILIPLTCPEGVDEQTARRRWIAGIRQAADAASANGVVFCLENVGKAFADKPADVAGVVDAVASPAVQVYYDPGNAVHGGMDPLEGIKVLGKRIQSIHVKDVGGTYLGEGSVPWPGVIGALRTVGYDGWLILETNATDDPRAAAARNLAALRAML